MGMGDKEEKGRRRETKGKKTHTEGEKKRKNVKNLFLPLSSHPTPSFPHQKHAAGDNMNISRQHARIRFNFEQGEIKR